MHQLRKQTWNIVAPFGIHEKVQVIILNTVFSRLNSIDNFLIWSELNAVTRVNELLPGKNQPTDLHIFTCLFTKVIHF